jgi:hypothetical protein
VSPPGSRGCPALEPGECGHACLDTQPSGLGQGPGGCTCERGRNPPERFVQTAGVAVFAVRVLLAPGFVVIASLAARRFGARVGGVVAGLPVIAGPILLVLALQHGTGFASKAAVGVLLGMVGLAAFVLTYAAVAARGSWTTATAAAYAAFAVVILAMRPVSVGPVVAFLVVCAALALTLLLLPRVAATGQERLPHPRWDLPFRAACTMALVFLITAVATTLGPRLSGLISAFPIITAVLTAFTHAQRGRDEAIRLLRGFTVGFFAYAVFCFIVATTVRPLGIAASFAIAAAAALITQTAVLAAGRRSLRADPPPAGQQDAIAPEQA